MTKCINVFLVEFLSPAKSKLFWRNWEQTINLLKFKVLFWFFAKGDIDDFFFFLFKPLGHVQLVTAALLSSLDLGLFSQ